MFRNCSVSIIKKTSIFVFFDISQENDQICMIISVSVAEEIQILAVYKF